MHIAVSSMLPT